MADEEAPSAKHGVLWDLQHGDRAKWIGVGIALLGLLFAFMFWRRGQSSQQGSASSVYPVQGQPGAGQQGSEMASQLGNLVSMISAQNAQTQQEIAALQQQAQPQADAATVTLAPPFSESGVWLHTSASADSPVGAVLRGPGVYEGPPVAGQLYHEPAFGSLASNMWQPISYGGQTYYAWAPEVNVKLPSKGKGGPEGVAGPHGIYPPNGFVQHEFAPTDQVSALGGARRPYRHV